VLDFYDQNGVRHWETLKEGTTKKEAEQALARRLIEIGKGQYLAPADRKVIFSDYARSWLKGRAGMIRPSTYGQYDDHIEKHLIPYFGAMRMTTIDFQVVEAYGTAKVEEAKKVEPGKKKAGVETINKTITTLGAIFAHALKARVAESNPVDLAERPKASAQEVTDGEDADDMQILASQHIALFLPQVTAGLWRMLFTTALMTGLREGEVSALQWGDVDWVSSQILVRRSVSREEKTWKYYLLKSKYSRRRIDVDVAYLHELKIWKMQSAHSEPDDLIFPGENGQPLHRKTIYRQLEPALRRAGVPRVRFHDLRHTYASLLIAQGEHPKYIQTQMGHSSIKVTMDIYGHLMEKVNVRSANRLANTVLGQDRVESSSKMVANAGTANTEPI
jgi:integrase